MSSGLTLLHDDVFGIRCPPRECFGFGAKGLLLITRILSRRQRNISTMPPSDPADLLSFRKQWPACNESAAFQHNHKEHRRGLRLHVFTLFPILHDRHFFGFPACKNFACSSKGFACRSFLLVSSWNPPPSLSRSCTCYNRR